MDLREALGTLAEKLDELEGCIDTARDEARTASSEAYDAKMRANNAENSADECIGTLNSAEEMLSDARDAWNELDELVTQIEQNEAGEEDGEKPVGLSALQKDIAKHKKKVLHIHARHPGLKPKKIASHLGIGEFLVKRILELEGKAA